MSLARQIVMLLDLATEPLSVRTLVAQITALGGDAGADAVHKRMHQMKAAGQARKEGDGWVLVDALPLQNLRAKWAREGQPAQTITQAPAVPPPAPSLRDRIVAALRENPGSTAQQLAEQIGGLAKNEPASTLNILCKQQRVRHEGEWPARRYFAHDGERVKLPRAGKRKKSGADSGIAKPADAGAESAPLEESALLLEQVEKWLEAHGIWCAPGMLATAMRQGGYWTDGGAVSDCLEQLVESGRAVSRYVSSLGRAKQYLHVRHEQAAESEPLAASDDPQTMEPAEAAPAPQAIESGPLTDTHGPIAAKGLRELAARESLAHAAHHALETLQDACNVVDQLADEVDGLAKAIGGDPATLPGYARCIALDLEDAIGRACDQAAPHAAIKALSVALGSTWRAITQLSPGA